MAVRGVIVRGALFLSAVALLAQQGDPARPRRELQAARQEARHAEQKLAEAGATSRSFARSLDSSKARTAQLDRLLAGLEAEQREITRQVAMLSHRRDSVESIRRRLSHEYSQVARALLKQQLMTPAASALLLPSEHRRLALKQRLFSHFARQQSARAMDIASARRFLTRQDSILRSKDSVLSALVDRRREQILAVLQQQGTDSASLVRSLRLREALGELLETKNEEIDQIQALISNLGRSTAPRPASTPPKAASAAASSADGPLRFTWPVSGRTIVRGYGSVRNKATGTVTLNPGIDIASTRGAPVRSVEAGEVSLVSWLPGYSTIVIVEHRDGYRTVYANLEATDIAVGASVASGEVLGTVGTAGNEAFLHFEIWRNQTRMDPGRVLGR